MDTDRSRRNFLRIAGGATIAGIGGSVAGGAAKAAGWIFRDERPLRTAVFFEQGFPGADDLGVTREALQAALPQETEMEFVPAADLPAKLRTGGFTLLVNPYGSAFPVESWTAIRKFLGKGGNLLNLGGAPFSVPVRREGPGWKQEVLQASYHKELGITEVFPVGVPEGASVRDVPRNGRSGEIAGTLVVKRVHELYVRFTSTRDYPTEDGTSGQRDAEIAPLAGVYSGGGDLLSAPVVVVDSRLGEFAGSRWVLANFSGTITTEGIGRLLRVALHAPQAVAVAPTFATYFPGEVPALRLRATERGEGSGYDDGGEWSITISAAGGKTVHRSTLSGAALRRVYAAAWVMPSQAARSLRPGFHTIEAEYRPESADGKPVERTVCRNGFWIFDPSVLNSGEAITVRGNAFYRGGEPFPVTGTSYMSEGVQRKFLFEPNPWLWERDFREMKEAGINMVRTGIWTGWKNVMLDVGSVNEAPLRALDAFILTARRHDIPVIFTFFAFLPEAWGGVNPYLDPRAVHAQKTFLSVIAARYRNSPGVIWDLINEPSFSSPDQLWYSRPNYDRYEAAAWRDWLIAGTPAADEASGLAIIRERYRQTPGEEPSLPPLTEFRDVNVVGTRRLFRPGDYRLFAQEMFRRWTAELSQALRAGEGPRQLITVGQDEGGTYERPGPHFFGPDVDFTSMHNWWHNDDILWDSLVTTVPGKPNLIQETGVMFYEKADGRPWRSEEETRNLLERKLAVTFAAGGAGFINWLWNTNPYMDSDNEAGIGLKRADGTLKPEFDVVRQYGRFFAAHAGLLGGSEPEDAVLVIPHTNLFSTRNIATDATKAAVRAAEYHCRMPLRTVSEYTLGALTAPPKLLIFPSPAAIDRPAWEKLLDLVKAGSTLLVTGPIDHDRYLMNAGRSAALGIDGENSTVGTEEHLTFDGKEYRVGFRGDRLQKVEKFVAAGDATPAVRILPSGRGRIIWAPLPVEAGDAIETVAALYRFAATTAGLRGAVEVRTPDPSVLVRPVVCRETVMVAFVSEAGTPRTISGKLAESGATFSLTVPARRSVIRLHHRREGTLLGELNPSLTGAF